MKNENGGCSWIVGPADDFFRSPADDPLEYVPPPLELLFCQRGARKGILLILGPRAGKGTGILILFFGRGGAGKGILLILGPRTGKGTGILLLFQTAGNGNGKFLGNLQ